MNNLEFAIINDFNRVKLWHDSEELSNEQIETINALVNKAWDLVTKDDILDFNFNGDYIPLYKNIALFVIDVLENNSLSFDDKRCYTYLVDNVYENIKNLNYFHN